MSTKDLFIEALSLPTKSRADLVAKLLVSLEREEASADCESAWDKEAQSRYRAFKKGRLKARPAEAVMKTARRSIR